MKVAPMIPTALNQQMALALFLHAMPSDVSNDDDDDVLTLDLGDELLRNPSDSFATYARSDCLAERGIAEGDLLLVDRCLKPQHNDIVIISIDGELLCRVLDMKDSCLRSGDTAQQAILLDEQVGLVVEGVVTQAVRKFR